MPENVNREFFRLNVTLSNMKILLGDERTGPGLRGMPVTKYLFGWRWDNSVKMHLPMKKLCRNSIIRALSSLI